MHRIDFVAPALAALALSACMSVGGPGVSTYYECERGTRLKVDFVGDRAWIKELSTMAAMNMLRWRLVNRLE